MPGLVREIMTPDPVTVGPDAIHLDEVYFCGPGCRDAYTADPARYS